MYSAQGLTNGIYTWDDLPDELNGPDGIWTKFPEPDDIINQPRVYQSPIEPEDDIILGDGGGFWSAFASAANNQCLVDPEWGFTDRFADTYTGQFYAGSEQTLAGSMSVSRVSLCRWQGSQTLFGITTPAVLEFVGLPPSVDSNFVGWNWNGVGTKGTTPQGGPTAQNNPYGFYSTEDGDIVLEIPEP
jgi:hypothetical protein